MVSSSPFSPNLIVDSSYQGHRSSSGPRRGGSGQRSIPLFAGVWLRRRYKGERESVLSCFAHSDDNAGDTRRRERRGGECAALLKGLRRFTLRRYDWIMSARERDVRMSSLSPIRCFRLILPKPNYCENKLSTRLRVALHLAPLAPIPI